MHTALDLPALWALADEYFEQHPAVDRFHATADGMFFPDDKKHLATAHAKQNELGAVQVFARDEDGCAWAVDGAEGETAPHATESGTTVVEAPVAGSELNPAAADQTAADWKARFGMADAPAPDAASGPETQNPTDNA